MLKGKTVLLCVTGSIAAYKIAYLASALKKLRADVHVIMTENATNFINPITFETLTGNKCLVDTFDRNFEFSVEHVSLAKLAEEANLTIAYTPCELEKIQVTATEVYRPGILLAGYYENFDSKRIQIIGLTEMSYLDEDFLKLKRREKGVW